MKNNRRFWIVNDDVKKYINQSLPISSDWLLPLEEYASIHNIPIIGKETKALLNLLGKLYSPVKILEIGTAIGYSALCFTEFLPENGSIETIEIDYDFVKLARENIKKNNLDKKITVIAGDAIDVLVNIQKKYDMIFIDAAKGQYNKYFNECKKLINKGGLIISDNVLYRGMVAKGDVIPKRQKLLVNRLDYYIKSVMDNDLFDSSLLPIGDGVLLSFRKDNNDKKS